MKLFKFGICLIITGLLVSQADAQRSGRRRQNTNNPAQPVDTTGQQQVNNVTNAPAYDPYGNLPIRIDSTGLFDTVIKNAENIKSDSSHKLKK